MKKKTNRLFFICSVYVLFAYLLLFLLGHPGRLASYSVVSNLLLLVFLGIPMLLAKSQIDIVLLFIPALVIIIRGMKTGNIKAGYIILLLSFLVIAPCNVYVHFKRHRVNYDESTQELEGTKELHLTDDSKKGTHNFLTFTVRSATRYIECASGDPKCKVLKYYHPYWAFKVFSLLLINAFLLFWLIKELLKQKGRFRYTIL